MGKMAPCKDTFRRCLKKVAAETLCVVRKEVADKTLHFACDAANKGGFHFMVKKLACHDEKNKDLNVMVVDSNVCDGTNRETAFGVDFFLVHPS